MRRVLSAILVLGLAIACGPKGTGGTTPGRGGGGGSGGAGGAGGGRDGDAGAGGSATEALTAARALVTATPPRIVEARDRLEAAHRAHPDHRGIALELARLRARCGDAAGARTLLERATTARDLTSDERVTAGLTWLELGDPAAGRTVVEAGLAADPAGPRGETADRKLAILDADLARAAGDRDRAHAIVEAILARDPKDPGAWAALARLLLDEGRPGAARYVTERALAAGLESGELHEARGLAAIGEGDPAAAAAHLAQALLLDPGAASAAARLGALRLEHGDARGAVAPLELAAAAYPRDVEVRVALGAARRLAGDAAGAAAALEEALAIAPDDPRALYSAARIYDEDLDQPDRALAHCRQYLAVKGEALPQTHPFRGACKALEKRAQGAPGGTP